MSNNLSCGDPPNWMARTTYSNGSGYVSVDYMGNQYASGTYYSPTWTTGWGTQYPSVITYPSGAVNQIKPTKEGIEMKNLYEVFLVYGEDRKNPIVTKAENVIANDDEDARVKSGIYSKVEKEWDADYLTIIVRSLGAVKIKERAKEVKTV